VLTREKKNSIVDNHINDFKAMKSAVLVDFKGVKVSQIDAFRKIARTNKVVFKVIKNTLAKKALTGAKADVLSAHFQGTTAIGYSLDSQVDPARIMFNYARENQRFKIKVGFLENALLSYDEIKALAELPSREELLARLLGTLNAPLSHFVRALSGIPQKFLYALSAIRDSKDKNK
jgi:large subunit ribosomal protein L10